MHAPQNINHQVDNIQYSHDLNLLGEMYAWVKYVGEIYA